MAPVHELIVTRHVVVTHDPERRYVRVTRTTVPATSVDEMHEMFARLERAAATIDAQRTRVLVDTRLAPMRAGDAFEPAWKQLGAILARFERVATLVSTAVGVLQTNRIAEGVPTRGATRTFTDEAAALAWLLED